MSTKNFLGLNMALAISCSYFLLPATAAELAVEGITEPYQDATLNSNVYGRLELIHKKEGDQVKAGEVILQLEQRKEELEAQRRAAIAQSKIEVEAAKKRVETLRIDFESTKSIFDETQSVSQEELNNIELEYNLAQAELDRLLLQEKQEELEHHIALAQLDDRSVVAPFDGIVIDIVPEVGEMCNPQQAIVRIANINKCRFLTHMDVELTWNLKVGDQVEIEVNAGGEALALPGTIEYIAPVVDPSSTLRKVKVLFENPDGKVPPGVNGRMIIE